MCRLLGIIANKAVDLRFSLVEGEKSLSSMSVKNPDGWGLGWYAGAEPKVVKEPVRADKSANYSQTAAHANSPIFIAHGRYATTGNPTKENCHPFQYKRWLFAHNGSVTYDRLLAKLTNEHRGALQGQTDSEVYFHWIIQNIEKVSAVEEGVHQALNSVADFTGLNFLLSDGQAVCAYRNASRNHAYYSLFYLVRAPDARGGVLFKSKSKEVDALIESKRLRGERAVLICSEKLTDEPWQEIPYGHFLTVGADLTPRLTDMR